MAPLESGRGHRNLTPVWFLFTLAALIWSCPVLAVGSSHSSYPADRSGETDCSWLSDEFPQSFVPNLINTPAAGLVERHHPVAAVSAIHTSLRRESFSNIVKADRTMFRLDYHHRVSRDFQFSMAIPFFKERLTFALDPTPNMPGTVSAVSFELKYLIPYEICGIRTSLGTRVATCKENSHPFFTPDDFQDISSIYIVSSLTPAPRIRLHSLAMFVNVPQPDGLVANRYRRFGFAYEHDLYRLNSNFVRFIAEANMNRFKTTDYNYYGDLARRNEVFFNGGLRIRTGIVQIDFGLRHFAEAGYREATLGLAKKF